MTSNVKPSIQGNKLTKKFEFTVTENNKRYSLIPYKGTVYADEEQEAVDEIKEYYAMELGIFEHDLSVEISEVD